MAKLTAQISVRCCGRAYRERAQQLNDRLCSRFMASPEELHQLLGSQQVHMLVSRGKNNASYLQSEYS